MRRIFVPRAKKRVRPAARGDVQMRDATELEIDEAIDESFPASDPPALHLEKDR